MSDCDFPSKGWCTYIDSLPYQPSLGNALDGLYQWYVRPEDGIRAAVQVYGDRVARSYHIETFSEMT